MCHWNLLSMNVSTECGIWHLSSSSRIGLRYPHPCAVGIVLAVVKPVLVCQMTMFLLSISRRKSAISQDPTHKKWTAVCLITAMVVSGTQWLVASLEYKTFPLEKLYFGPRPGNAVGVVLEPFETIFRLHAAMMAYELYTNTLHVDR